MEKHFVWTHEIESMINEALQGKSKHLASKGDAIVKLFGEVAEASEHYYALKAAIHQLTRNLKSPSKSSIYRSLERNQRLWGGVCFLFSALELEQVLDAPNGSIIIPKFGIGGYSFEILKPGEPNYTEAFARLPGAA